MSKINSNERRGRKSVELPAHVDDAVAALADKLGISVAEVIRRAAERLVKEEAKREEGFEIGAFKETEDGRIARAYLYEL